MNTKWGFEQVIHLLRYVNVQTWINMRKNNLGNASQVKGYTAYIFLQTLQ